MNRDGNNNNDDESQQEESSSRHLLFALEDLLKRSHSNSIFTSKIKYQSKSVDDLLIHRRHRRENSTNDSNNISIATLTNLDSFEIEYDDDDEENNNDYDSHLQRSRSTPILSKEIYDKELAAFVQCDQQQQQSTIDNFVYNIDLSDPNDTSDQLQSRLAVFFEDDYSSETIDYEPIDNFISSPLINSCLTITEENEEELEQLRRDDDDEKQQQQQENLCLEINKSLTPIIILVDNNNDETILFENDNQIENIDDLSLITMDQREDSLDRLSTIYESPSPQPDTEEDLVNDDIYDKLVVYDIATVNKSTKYSIIHPIPKSIISTTLSYHSPITSDRTRIDSRYTDASMEGYSKLNSTLSVSRLCGTTATIMSKVYNQSPLTISHNENSSSSPVIIADNLSSSLSSKQQIPSRSSPMLLSSSIQEQSVPSQPFSPHIKTMKVIQSSSSSLSDFISSSSIPPLQNTIHYKDIPDIHHSLTDCSLVHPTSSLIDENNLIKKQISNNNERKISFNRRILTNGLLRTHYARNPIPRCLREPFNSIENNSYPMKVKSEEKFLSDTSSSSAELLSSSDEKLLTRSEYIFRQEQNNSQQRKASSLKSIFMTSPQLSTKILYPIDFDTNNINTSWLQKRSSVPYKVPTFDSGIVIDTNPTSKSSINEDPSHGTINMNQLKHYETYYHKILTDMTYIKKNIVDIESRLNEVMRELQIEQALIEGEHELVFKQILDASESDQQKIRQLHKNLQLLVERIMTEKDCMRNEISYTQQILFRLEHELRDYEQQYRASDEKILQKKEIISATRKNYEDLEFQLMELETRCESELEQSEEHFRNEQKLVTQNAKMRQNTLRELDHQQYIALHQATMEKDKLEREKQKLQLIYKQKKIEANEFERKIHDIWSNNNNTIHQSTPLHLYRSLNYQDELSTSKTGKTDDLNEMMNKIKFEKKPHHEPQLRERFEENINRVECEQKSTNDYQVKLREKTRAQERPLTRYLPIRSADFDLRAHIEGAGHILNSSHISLTSTTCRGYLHKMGGIKFKTWNRRWFVFDRERRSLSYYHDKNELKLRGCIYFQSILEVYIDQLQSISLRSPEPREATFIVKTIQRPYYLVAPTIELMRIWIDVIITGAEGGNTFANA
ncbi:unnamed protein product [Adineta steineri]|uniref:PH domain-containing protein n=2 Tax=Adineta steineri TaxID=433720 RepID=A0A815HNV7_9BILA|nr:unnamed protein product [Adineta steineri]